MLRDFEDNEFVTFRADGTPQACEENHPRHLVLKRSSPYVSLVREDKIRLSINHLDS